VLPVVNLGDDWQRGRLSRIRPMTNRGPGLGFSVSSPLSSENWSPTALHRNGIPALRPVFPYGSVYFTRVNNAVLAHRQRMAQTSLSSFSDRTCHARITLLPARRPSWERFVWTSDSWAAAVVESPHPATGTIRNQLSRNASRAMSGSLADSASAVLCVAPPTRWLASLPRRGVLTHAKYAES
jgi:hypothetical protein